MEALKQGDTVSVYVEHCNVTVHDAVIAGMEPTGKYRLSLGNGQVVVARREDITK